MQRLKGLQTSLQQHRAEFTELAQRHSECPTAMQNGLLGRIKPGQLYRELDAVLFQMEEGEISEILESPIGLHLLMCEQIHIAERRSFKEIKEKLCDHLEMKKRKMLLHKWLQQST